MATRFFCPEQKHDFSEIFDDHHMVFKRYLPENLTDLLETKTGRNFIGLKILFREKNEKIEFTNLPRQKLDLPSYHGILAGCRSQLKSIAQSPISPS